MSLDALLVVMEDRADGEVALEGFERFFDGYELNVVAPEFRGIVVGQIGPQQITPFAASDLSELFAIERKGQLAGFVIDFGLDETPDGGCLGARRAELDQPFLAGHVHVGELLQTRPQPFQLSPPHRALFVDAIGALSKDIEVRRLASKA